MDSDNSSQVEFWNADPGRRWVDHQVDLDTLIAGVQAVLLADCAPMPGEAVLDVGCGAGDTTLALCRAVGPGRRVLGLDISEPLLARAADRARAAGIGHAAFLVADAQTHAFAPGAFDLIASRFGVMFFSDPVAAFRNLGSALESEGRIAFAAWAGPEGNPWFTVPQRIAVDRLGPVDPVPADAPGPMAFRDIDRVCGLLSKAGLTDVSGREVAVDLHHPQGVATLKRLVAHVGPTARVMRERGGTEADLQAIIAAVGDAFSVYATPDGIRIPATINLFTARRG